MKNETYFREVQRALHGLGFVTDVFHDWEDAEEALAAYDYSLILRSSCAEGSDGVNWLRDNSLRRKNKKSVYIIMITRDENERIAALEAGADDSVSFSVKPRELAARVRAVLRRPPVVVDDFQSYEDLTLCQQSREVRAGEKIVSLQRRETDVLETLLRQKGRVVPRARLEHEVYGAHVAFCPNSLEVRISRIRRQLASAGSRLTIETVRGVGYRLAIRNMMATQKKAYAVPVEQSGQPSRRVGILQLALILFTMLGLYQSQVQAQGFTTVQSGNKKTLSLSPGKGTVLHLERPAASILIADPDIMDVQCLPHNMLFVFGKKMGDTTFDAFDRSGHPLFSAKVDVSPNMDALKQTIRGTNGRDVSVEPSPGGVVLSGRVRSPASAADLSAMAQQYAGPGGKVTNRLRVAGPVQVSLRVRVAEVQRGLAQHLGFDWSTVFNNVGSFAIGAATGGLGGAPSFISNASSALNGVSGSYSGGHASAVGTLDVMASEGLATMLAEPNLTTMSGEPATFLSGGEFPVPVPQGFGTVGVNYQHYGVSISFTPVVLSNGTISIHVAPEVSSISTDVSNGAYSLAGTAGSIVPAVQTNKAETTIQLASGQSFAIGGLISNTMRNAINKVPGLGDLPVLGALFRSTSFQHDESELIIVVTAYTVRPSDQAAALPTDYLRPTTVLESLLMGRTSKATGSRGRNRNNLQLIGAGGFMYP